MTGRRLFSALLCIAALAAGTASAAKLKTLYSFCAESGCTDGREPSAGLVSDADGNLFGTTLFGGDAGNGVVYELARHGAKYKYKRLYSFCDQPSCADGADAEAALIVDTAGALYGTTMAGGAADGGVVYKLTPNARHNRWTYSVLYSFCAQADCTDGRLPQAALYYDGKETGAAYDGASPLYGTASLGGANKQGVAFKLTPGAPLWNQQVLHHFCALAGCADGASPNAALTVDGAAIYGTTYFGGDANMGTAFKLVGTTESVLHSFCSSAKCADGAFPAAALHLDASGNLLGTTFGGGRKTANCTDIGVAGCGTAFMLAPDGHETVLHAFCTRKNCADGGYPLAGLVADASQKLFGVSLYGGGNGESPGAGVLFSLDGTAKTLYRFCKQDDCGDGVEPEGDLLMDASGSLFGTTLFQGANGDGGTVFELTP